MDSFKQHRWLLKLTVIIVIAVVAMPAVAQTPSPGADKAEQAKALVDEANALLDDQRVEPYLKLIDKYKAALTFYEELHDDFRAKDVVIYLALAVNRLGLIYNRASDRRNALVQFKQALTYYRVLGNRGGQGDVLNSIAKVYEEDGDRLKALEYYKETFQIFRSLDDKRRQGRALNNIGLLYSELGEQDTAIQFYLLSIPLHQTAGDRSAEAATLGNIGMIYWELGNNLAALDYHNRALKIQNEINDNAGAAQTLNNIGLAFNSNNETKLALDFYELALKITRDLGDKGGEGRTLNNIGSMYRRTGDHKQALTNYSQALEILRKTADKEGEAAALTNLGTIYSRDKATVSRALEHYNKALEIFKAFGNKSGEAAVLSNIMMIYDELNKPQLAIVYGKQAVNLKQGIRRSITSFDKQTQDSYLKNALSTYRTLSELLIGEGRLIEARAVLDLLKEKEYGDLVRSGEADTTVPYQAAEASVITLIENLASLERERAELQKLLATGSELTTEQNNRLAKLNADLATANKAFDAAINALGRDRTSSSAKVDEIKSGKVLQSALTDLSEKTNSGVVALYTVLGSEEDNGTTLNGVTKKPVSKFGWVIMVTENRYTAYPIDVTDLEQNVFQLRTALSSDKYDPRPIAAKIYNALFRRTSPKLKKTLEQDLSDYLRFNHDKTLMWSLDGVLRYLPMAALFDGKQYLAEEYRNTVFTRESFVWLMNDYNANWKALGFGVSDKRGNFDELPGVKTELETIVREQNSTTGILSGSIKLNDNFKKQTFFNIVSGGLFPVVHISSHYSFDPVKPENSFLLAGDGNLTFAEIKEQQNLFKKTDLLTLSACDTGVSGNGKEAEGFAYLAQSLGARSVIASLWKVSDAATPELMIRFYTVRSQNPQMPKGEAFRRAQLSLLRGETITGTPTGGKRSDPINIDDVPGLPLFTADPARPFAHPHYWASFVLIGNWR